MTLGESEWMNSADCEANRTLESAHYSESDSKIHNQLAAISAPIKMVYAFLMNFWTYVAAVKMLGPRVLKMPNLRSNLSLKFQTFRLRVLAAFWRTIYILVCIAKVIIVLAIPYCIPSPVLQTLITCSIWLVNLYLLIACMDIAWEQIRKFNRNSKWLVGLLIMLDMVVKVQMGVALTKSHPLLYVNGEYKLDGYPLIKYPRRKCAPGACGFTYSSDCHPYFIDYQSNVWFYQFDATVYEKMKSKTSFDENVKTCAVSIRLFKQAKIVYQPINNSLDNSIVEIIPSRSTNKWNNRDPNQVDVYYRDISKEGQFRYSDKWVLEEISTYGIQSIMAIDTLKEANSDMIGDMRAQSEDIQELKEALEAYNQTLQALRQDSQQQTYTFRNTTGDLNQTIEQMKLETQQQTQALNQTILKQADDLNQTIKQMRLDIASLSSAIPEAVTQESRERDDARKVLEETVASLNDTIVKMALQMARMNSTAREEAEKSRSMNQTQLIAGIVAISLLMFAIIGIIICITRILSSADRRPVDDQPLPPQNQNGPNQAIPAQPVQPMQQQATANNYFANGQAQNGLAAPGQYEGANNRS